MKILLMTAHPDDADIMAGGTIAHWTEEGHDVHSVIFTRGDKGHDDPTMTADIVAALREAEQRAAAAILGVTHVTFLDFIDGELEWAGQTMSEIATRIVRREQPDIVVTHDPYAGAPGYRVPQLHPDHRAVGSAVVDACYFRAPGPLYYPDHGRVGLRPHRVREVFLIMSDHADHASISVRSSSARSAQYACTKASSAGIPISRDSCEAWRLVRARPLACKSRSRSSD
jgi:LmbE family N-acetylglucosaminyl deacetylase